MLVFRFVGGGLHGQSSRKAWKMGRYVSTFTLHFICLPMTPQQLKDLEDNLWEAATTLRNSSGLKSNEYSTPILGIVFLRYIETLYAAHATEIEALFEAKKGKRDEVPIEKIAITSCGFYLPPHARYDYLKNGEFKPLGKTTREALQEAMRSVEAFNDMPDTLPINEYEKLTSENIDELLKKFATIPLSAETDVFGKIYEFFLGEFALGEGQKGGEFYTPPAVVRLMVEVIEPTGGKLLDPACGSGGMFVQSANYLRKNAVTQLNKLSVYGYEKSRETARLAKMNAKINGLRAFITTANTFETQDDFQNTYDYVLANPPFNVKEVKAETVEHKSHFNAYGLPKNKGKAKGDELIPNANYLWISLFTSALKPHGKAGLVMANSASDASGAELDIRRNLIEEGQISAMLTLSSNMFNTVTLPATLWFFEKQPNTEPISLYTEAQETLPMEATLLQAAEPNETYTTKEALPQGEKPLLLQGEGAGAVRRHGEVQVLFVDARNIFTQISRKQRTFTDEQVQNIATIFRLQRGQTDRFRALVAQYEAQAGEYEQQAADFYPQVEAQQTLLAEVEAVIEALQPTLAHADKKEREKAERELAKIERERNREQKELERLQAAHADLLKQRDYYLQNRDWLTERFPDGTYRDVTGLCKLASLAEIAEQNYSLNPGRYVGVVIEQDGLSAEEFTAEMQGYYAELESLNAQAHSLEQRIAAHFTTLFSPQTTQNDEK